VASACTSCGTIENIRAVEQPGEASGLGAVAGGVIGGILGNQIGGGSGRKIATVAGAAGGAYAGHQIEKSRNKTVRYAIDVRMNDGTLRTLEQAAEPVWRSGDKVKVENGALRAQ
jgi:outer membrane lipoprotein SlyB